MTDKADRLALRREGLAALHRGEIEKAIESLTACLAIFADDAAARVGLGIAYSHKKWYDQSMQMFEKAAKIRPMSADLYYDWAKAMTRAGRIDEAIATYQRVLKLNPKHPKAARKLAKLEEEKKAKRAKVDAPKAPAPAPKSPLPVRKSPLSAPKSPAPAARQPVAAAKKSGSAQRVVSYDSKIPAPTRRAAVQEPEPAAAGHSLFIPFDDREMPALPPAPKEPEPEHPPEFLATLAVANRSALRSTTAPETAKKGKRRLIFLLTGVAVVFAGIGATLAWLQPWKSKPATNNEAQAKSTSTGTGDPFAPLLADLRNDNALRRREACEKLSELDAGERRGEIAAVISPLLSDADGSTRAACAKALGKFGSAEQVPALLSQLGKDDFPAAKREELIALGKLKDERAVEPVAQHLTETAYREAAVQALIAFGPVAEKKVRDYLRPNVEAVVRIEACRILQHIGGKDSVSALETAKSDANPKVAKAAEDALKAIGVKK
jgi:tetratricopeptide (TPR) repeat protein